MTEPTNTRMRTNGLRITGWALAAGILLLPLVAMQFTDEVNWTVSDFVTMGALLIGTGLILELAAWKIRDVRYRIGFSVLVLVLLVLVWIEGAVGIFN